MYDLSTHAEKRVTPISGYCGEPKVSGNNIIYDNNLDVYSYNIKTYKRIKQITSTSEYSIYGNKIAYSKWHYSGTSYTEDIFVKDILYGITTPICINSHTQENPAIYVSKVVWEDWRNGNEDIYMGDIPLTIFKVNPSNNAINVARNKVISITFSIPVKSSTYFSSITLKNLSTGTYKTLTKTISGNILKMKSKTILSANTWYQVTIPAKAMKDYTGNNLFAKYTFKFKTGT